MKRLVYLLLTLFAVTNLCAQKDSLQLGSSYADDQLYASISYAQFFNQPTLISRSGFSYAISAGFMKDIILNKNGNISIALGVGYGFDFFNHQLEVEEINGNTNFSISESTVSNIMKTSNLEFPIEFRWRTSSANKYKFWRIYGGVKLLYSLSNTFEYVENDVTFSYRNVSAFNNLQYGLTLSAGYDVFNVNVFYGLTPIFNDAELQAEAINSRILKFGLIFYLL